MSWQNTQVPLRSVGTICKSRWKYHSFRHSFYSLYSNLKVSLSIFWKRSDQTFRAKQFISIWHNLENVFTTAFRAGKQWLPMPNHTLNTPGLWRRIIRTDGRSKNLWGPIGISWFQRLLGMMSIYVFSK